MFTPTNNTAARAAEKNREAITLDELKTQLGYRGSTAPDGSADDGLTEAAISAFLMRFLRSKNLSTAEAIAKLKRRRAFESTLPTISITPTVISILRSGAFSVLGNDNRGRPVLFLNLRDFALPPIEVDEAQRIAIVLLEFMQSKCLAASAVGSGEREDDVDTTDGPAHSTSSSHPASPAARSQSFTLLINDEGAPWSVHLPLLRKATTLYAIFAKYYPGLVDLVLIAEASFEVRQGIQAALAGSRSEVIRQVLMVQRSDLSRYLPASATPACLGGGLETAGNALNFAEAVLRHWYTVTSYLQLEANLATGGGAPGAGLSRPRPLYQPTPIMTSMTQFASLRRAAALSAYASIAGRRPGSALASLGQAAAGLPAAPGAGDVDSQLSNSRVGGAGGPLEDGVCSQLSADDVTFTEGDAEGDGAGHCGHALGEGSGAGAATRLANGKSSDVSARMTATVDVARPLEAAEVARVRSDPAYAVAALEQERGLRTRAEQRLTIAQLGVTLDPRSLSTMERQLAAVHQELNVLVAEVAVRARAAAEKGAEASVSQLLDLTLTALEAASCTPEDVPAMSLAVPQQREPESSTCCTIM